MTLRRARQALGMHPRVMLVVLLTAGAYARVVEVMDACRAAGIERIGVVTAPDQTP